MNTSLDLLILAALIGELGLVAINSMAHCLRTKGVGMKSILAACGLSLPVWVVMFFCHSGDLVMPWQYIAAVLVWMVLSYGISIGTRFSVGTQGPAEGMALRFVFVAIFAVLADCIVFGTQYSPALMTTLGLFFVGGVLIHFNRFCLELKPAKLIKIQYKIGFAAAIALAEVAAFALFKFGASMQVNPYVNVSVFMALSSLIYLFFGIKALMHDKKTGYMSVCKIAAFAVAAAVAWTAGGVALAGIPVALFALFTVVRGAWFAMCDMKSGTVKFSPVTAAGVIFVILGLLSTLMITGF